VKKVAEVYGKKLGKELDPMKNILVTQGANGALSAFVNAYANKGDEVVTFCPMFPLYIDHIELSGAQINAIPLEY
jgi:aspartate/methionine/tyrosine aminotransferase